MPRFRKQVEGFLAAMPSFASWNIQRVAIATSLSAEQRRAIADAGVLPQDLSDLTTGL